MNDPAKFNNVVSFLWAIAELASGEGVDRTVNDCCCGTGGMLTITKDRIQQINPQAKVFLYGQTKTARRQRRFGLAQRARRVRRRGKPTKQLNRQTWAIARSDMQFVIAGG